MGVPKRNIEETPPSTFFYEQSQFLWDIIMDTNMDMVKEWQMTVM